MPTPFDLWSLEDARIAVQLSTEDGARLDSYRKFIKGDHWQDWAGWIGPQPLATDTDALTVREEIVKGFVSRNATGECVGRHVNGCLGRDVKWTIVPRRKLKEGKTPTADEQALIDEATDLLTEWVEVRKLNQEYDKVGEHLLVDGIAYQRPFVPPGELSDDGTLPEADIAGNLGRVYVHLPRAGEAAVYTDPRAQAKCSVYLYREVTSSRPSQAQGQGGEERAELTYLDGDKTVVRIIGRDGAIEDGQGADFRYALGKRLLMADMQRKPLLNPQVVSQQKLLNLALTMKERNVILGGFLERVAINAQMNGAFETLADGTRRFVADTLPVGAGAMTTLTGYILRDNDGNETIASPNMLWRDPVDVKTFLDTEQSSYEHILAECNQLHYAAAGSTGISAESRQIAQAAYLIDLLQSKQQLDTGWAWLLETALALAAVLSNQAGRFDSLRVSAECSVDPGPISADMMTTTQTLTGGQPLLSVKTGRSWVGIEDVDGEQQQIATEQKERLERQVAEAKAMPQDTAASVRGAGAGGSNPGVNGNGTGATMLASVQGRAA